MCPPPHSPPPHRKRVPQLPALLLLLPCHPWASLWVTYAVTQAGYDACSGCHRGSECGYPYRAGMRMWRLSGMRPLAHPVRTRTLKGYRRWTPIEPIYNQ